MPTILDLEAWLTRAELNDQAQARSLYQAVQGETAVEGYECQACEGLPQWLVRSPRTEDTLVLATPVHREALLGMLRQRHDVDQRPANRLPSSKLTSWRLPPHVSALAKERAAAALTPHA